MPKPRLVASLVRLREQINALSPGRNKSSDGWIGDTSHAARKSDHNPDEKGLVYALDITHDPANGVNSEEIANTLRKSRDKRLQYVISNGRIANMDIADGAWRVYKGSNPHAHHCHISVRHPLRLADDPRNWTLPGIVTVPLGERVPDIAAIRPGAPESTTVNELKQSLVKLVNSEKGYGVLSEALVRAYQKQKGLTQDGVVGRQTLDSLHHGEVT